MSVKYEKTNEVKSLLKCMYIINTNLSLYKYLDIPLETNKAYGHFSDKCRNPFVCERYHHAGHQKKDCSGKLIYMLKTNNSISISAECFKCHELFHILMEILLILKHYK
jgi:hypothetical protein